MIKAVIFDMDGLMFDTERLYDKYWLEVNGEYRLDITPELLNAMRGVTYRESEQIFNAHCAKGTCSEMGFEKVCDMVSARVHASLALHVPLRPGLFSLLDALKAKHIPMAIASSTYREQVVKNLEGAKVSEYFSAIICGDMVANGKPAPDIFIAAAAALGIASKDCLVLEDSYNGIRAGTAAGCRAIMIPDMDAPTPEMQTLATAILPSLSDVIAWLDKL